MKEKLRSSDYRLILICFLICAAGLVVGIRLFYRVFPEASIDFKVDKNASEDLGRSFLAAQSISLVGYRHASSFRFDDEAKVFMERELGLQKANALMGKEVKLWRWGHRWFKPLQKEEVRMEVTTRGEVVSFIHLLPEDAAGADLPANAARSLAESFLVLDMKRPIDTLEYLDSQSEKRPHRTDHLFTWKVIDVDLHGATYRVSVTVQGDRIDGYGEFLKIPEEWRRSYARLRSLNETTAQVDLVFFALLGLAMLAAFGHHLRQKDVRWKTALAFGAISCLLQFLSSLNEFPLAEYGFDTASSYGSFVAQSLLSAALGALSFGGIIFLLTACVEPVYRQAHPSHLSISKMFSWNAIRTRSFFLASMVGVTLTFFFFAYEIGFYLLANRLGAWAPAEIPYTDLLNTKFPWIFVLLGGFFPAVSEEWMFRAFSIPYLRRLFRYRWVAVFLASFIWGFGHANYPNQPFFIRGIEVGIVGLILSWVMIRYGILATLITHYSIDAFYSAFLFLRSGNPYLVASGAVTAGINLIPLLLAAGAYLTTRHFKEEAPVINQSEGSALEPAPIAPPEAVPTVASYTRLTSGAAAAAVGLLATGILLTMLLRVPHFGDTVRFRQSAAQAVQSAGQFLTRIAFDVGDYRHAVQPFSRVDSWASQYIYNSAGITGLNSVYGSQIRPLAWQVRYYKPLQKEEYRVAIDPDSGSVVAFRRTLPEEAPGADLAIPKARDVCKSFLESRGYNLSRYDLKETRTEKPRQRRDTAFIWEAQPGSPGAIGDARVRLEAGVLGNKIGLWTQYVKIPEEWRRNRERQSLYGITAIGIRTAFLIALFCVAIMSLIRGTRQGMIRWKLAIKIAAAAALLELINLVNSFPKLIYQYDTQTEMRVFVLSALVESVLLLIGIGLAVALASAIIMACYPDAPYLFRKQNRELWSRDAVVACGATLGVAIILQWVVSQIGYRASRLAVSPEITFPDSLGTYLPFISNVHSVLLSALFFSAVVAFSVDLWQRAARRWHWRVVLLTGLLASFLPLSARRVSEVVIETVPAILFVGLVCIVVVHYIRNNYLACLLSAGILSLERSSSSMIEQSNTQLAIQGWLLWILALGGMIWLWRQSNLRLTIDD
ncbi:MAG TPA: type II CAAX endopeptidase family protein [Acidobacteriota bacterium]|nr:type II CAAX endopeptidase family protein [Acidobacteriota bacterium]